MRPCSFCGDPAEMWVDPWWICSECADTVIEAANDLPTVPPLTRQTAWPGPYTEEER
ncbi:MAG TPA: hypothetical protein VMD09_12800 [Solirubrobacteraceae bacterium]|nr:hypothetical protein [Solirubrobacteraceae bacterium]